MTCIAAVAHKGKVTMGGDSAGCDGWCQLTRADAKVFRNGDFLIGFTSSFRMGQILQYRFTPPPYSGDDPMRYMVAEFVEAARETLKAGGYVKTDSGREEGGSFLVGFRGRIYSVGADFQVGETAAGYDAVGGGYLVALGALHATPRMAPARRVRLALDAAASWASGVRGPFCLLTV